MSDTIIEVPVEEIIIEMTPEGKDGRDGQPGPQGPEGPQGPAGPAPVWGNITGTLADQADLQNALDGKAGIIHTTASGAIAHITDGAPYPVDSLMVNVDPVQDLHGYANPWPAGGGKNIMRITKSAGTDGDVTFSVTTDEAGNVIGLKASGTITANANIFIGEATVPADGTYKFSGLTNGSAETALLQLRDSSNNIVSTRYTDESGNLSLTAGTYYTVYRVLSGATITNMEIKPMLRLASSATGYAPYSNECPISGHTEAVVTRTGRNLLNKDDAEIGTAWNGASNSARARLVIPCKPSTQYTLSMNGTNGMDAIMMTDSATVPASISGGGVTFPATFTTGSTSKYIILAFNKTDISQTDVDALKLQLELGSTATAYEPYQGTSVTIDLNGTRYGATVNVLTGEMTVTHGIKTFVGASAESWNLLAGSVVDGNGLFHSNASDYLIPVANYSTAYICDRFGTNNTTFSTATIGSYVLNQTFRIRLPNIETVDACKAWLANNNVNVCYPLATPVTVQLDPETLSLLAGENNVWADTGDTSVGYRADTKLYIDGKLAAAVAELQALILEH